MVSYKEGNMRSGIPSVILLFSIILTAGIAPAEPFTLSYLERPPYYFTTEKGAAAGFLLERTRNIIQTAGIEAQFIPVTPNRALYILRNATVPHCGIGWFKNSERELFARFTEPIYRNQTLVLLTASSQRQKFSGLKVLQQVFSDRSLIMARMGNFSYGSYVDQILSDLVPESLFFSTEQGDLLAAIHAGKASYMIMAPEEIDMLIRSTRLPAEDFVRIELEDIPAGNLRYLMCGQGVDAELLEKLNTAIRKLYPTVKSLNP